MSYAKKLEDIIEASGLSLNQIKNKCKSYNVNVTPSYISKLKSGGSDPASETINRAIARACGTDPNELVFEAYMEKAPETIKNFIDGFSRYILKATKESLKLFLPKEQHEIVESKLNQFTTYDMIKEFNENNFNLPNPFKDAISLTDPNDKEVKIIVPKLGMFQMNDDSMKPLINKTDKLQLDNSDKINIGDIVIYQLEDDTYLTRRYFEKDNKIILVPDNKKYEVKEFKKDNIKFIGRVKSIIKEI